MSSRRSPSITSPRAITPSAIVWRALGWLGVAAWLAQVTVNAASYFRGHRWPPSGNLAPRLIALPAALRLPPPLATQAAWIVAALALYLTTVVSALTFWPGPGDAEAALASPQSAPEAAPASAAAPTEATHAGAQPQSLRARTAAGDSAISASVAALSAPAQSLFAALGVFASDDIGRGALLAVGEALGDADARASLDALLDARLADAALSDDLPAEAEGAEHVDRERLRLHPLARAYARDLLDGPPWTPERRMQAECAVAAWYADYLHVAPPEALAPDRANISGALAWADTAGDDRLLTQLCAGMTPYWSMRDATGARERYLPLAVAAALRLAAETGDRDDHLRAAHLEIAHAELLRRLGADASARSLLENSLQTYTDLHEQCGEGIALCKLGDLALQEGDLPAARAAYERALALMWIIHDQRGVGVALCKLGDLALHEGDLPAARAAYERALTIMRDTHDLRNEGALVPKLGDIALEEGDISAARAAYERYLAIMRDVHDEREESIALVRLADVSERVGDADDAEALYRQALAIVERINNAPDVADTLLLAGHFLTRQKRGGDEGRRMLAEAMTIYTRLGRAEHAEYAQALAGGSESDAG